MKKRYNVLLYLIMFATFLVMVVVAGNVFLVAVTKIHFYSGTDISLYADTANIVVENQTAKRGYIFDRNGNIIAQDNQTYNIVCYLDSSRPAASGQIAYVDDPLATAIALADYIDMDVQDIYDYLTKDVYQTELGSAGRYLSKETKDAIEALDLNGIEFTESIKRSYPYGTFASHLVGYAQYNDEGELVGKMGIESAYNDELTGVDGYKKYQADKNGDILPGVQITEEKAQNGNNVYLTLDASIQEAMEEAFVDTAEHFNVSKIWAGVMEVDTGKILAWGQYPDFDPNTLEITDYLNYGSEYPYEAGSVMKVFTYAAAIDFGTYDGLKEVDSSNFYWGTTSDGNPYRTYAGAAGAQSTYITNANNKTYGMVEYDYGLIQSLNTVTANLICDTIAPSTHLNYLKAFGFFSYVGTEGISEVNGVLNYSYAMDKLALTYGQGSSVTMLQLLQAFSAIFSDGTMVKPYVVDSIRDSYDNTNVIYQAETEVVGHPISAESAQQIQDLMYRVVYDEEKGTGKYYQLDEVDLIAKTGTTQVVSDGSYASGKTIVSVMMGIPADDPQVIVYYAFEGGYDRNAHANNSGAKTLARKTAQILGLAKTSEEIEEEESSSDDTREVISYTMPTLVNHTVEYAEQQIEEMDTDLYILGSGTEIIGQYPEAGEAVSTDQVVLLMTDDVSVKMPDMTGWSRKECAAFWSLTGVGVRMDGLGIVYSQSISPGTIVDSSDEVEVFLK